METHLFFQQEALHQWLNKYHIQQEAWGPLAQHRISEVIHHPILLAIAKKYQKTPTQVALRFNVQRGIVVIPKTINKKRMEENLDILDFSLSAEDMSQIKQLDENTSLWSSYDNPEIVELAMS